MQKAPLPLFIPFRELMIDEKELTNNAIIKDPVVRKNSLIDLVLEQKVYENSILRMAGGEVLDLNALVDETLRMQRISSLVIAETHKATQLLKIRKLICERFYDIFGKLAAISIDGFKRERYVIKINFLKSAIERAQDDLMMAETAVEQGTFTAGCESLSDQISLVTDLMLQIETLTKDRVVMEETLKEKDEKWQEDDKVFKRRRIVLNYIVELNRLNAAQASHYQCIAYEHMQS